VPVLQGLAKHLFGDGRWETAEYFIDTMKGGEGMLYKEDLDEMQCAECGETACEDPIFFHGRCHLGKPTWCSYFDGELIIICSECEQEIARIAVARKEDYGIAS